MDGFVNQNDIQNRFFRGLGRCLSILSVLVCACFLLLSAHSMALAAPGQAAESKNDAQRELREQAGQDTPGTVELNSVFVPVESVVIKSNSMSETSIKDLVPEVNKKTLSVRQLSRQIRLVNEGGAMHLDVDIQPGPHGKYIITVTAQEKQSGQGNITASNTGNDYTGNWLVVTRSTKSKLAGYADISGAAHVSSASDGHSNDVKIVSAPSQNVMDRLTVANEVQVAELPDVQTGLPSDARELKDTMHGMSSDDLVRMNVSNGYKFMQDAMRDWDMAEDTPTLRVKKVQELVSRVDGVPDLDESAKAAQAVGMMEAIDDSLQLGDSEKKSLKGIVANRFRSL